MTAWLKRHAVFFLFNKKHSFFYLLTRGQDVFGGYISIKNTRQTRLIEMMLFIV